MKFVDVFQFFNYLLEEMSRCNCFSLQLLGGGDSRQTLDREAGVLLGCAPCLFLFFLPSLLAGLLPIPISPPQTCSLLRRHLIGPHIFVTSTNEDDFLAEANLTVMTPFVMPAYFHRGILSAGTNERVNQNAGHDANCEVKRRSLFVRLQSAERPLPDRKRARQREESAEDGEEKEEEARSQSCWQPFKRRCSI